MNQVFFPNNLKKLPVWILWKLEPDQKGRMTKVPYSANYDGKASSVDSSTWTTFEKAFAKYDSHREEYNGLGIVVSEKYRIVFIDIDHCVHDGTLDSRANDILGVFNGITFAEYSQSGSGIHILALGEAPKSFNNRSLSVEMYMNAHFCAMTGNAVSACEMSECQEAISYVFERYRTISKPKHEHAPSNTSLRLSDSYIIKKASESSKFSALYAGDWTGLGYESQSEADSALCSILAFWTDADIASIDRIFRSSGLYRAKWDREDYRLRTITNACSIISETLSEFVSRRREQEGRELENAIVSKW